MARRKQENTDQVKNLIAEAQSGLDKQKLLLYAKELANKKGHVLLRHLNKYPFIPFKIDINDIKDIAELKHFPSPVRGDHKWTPWEKIFYAILWKDGKLKSIKRIIEGAETALKESNSQPGTGVVYHYFGRHLTDPVNEPILDQHTIRAHKLITNKDPNKVEEIRKLDQPTGLDAEKYREWFREVMTRENITTYDDARALDSYLFALGSYAKSRNKGV